MPAPTLLVSFIGKGRRDQSDPRGGYKPASYAFPPENGHAAPPNPEKTSLFAGALLRRLQALGRRPQRWLVLGSPQSNWDNLENALDPDALDPFLQKHSRLFTEIRGRVDQGGLSDEALAPWGQALAEALRLDVSLRIVGACDTPPSQLALWKALESAARDGDDLVIDITHGLRHMPLLAVSMVMLLRRIRNIGSVVFYYGAYDLGPDLCPVLKLDLPGELVRAAEGIFVEQATGSIAALPDLLPSRLQDPARQAAFLLGIGRLKREDVKELLKKASDSRPQNPIETAALFVLERRLRQATDADQPHHSLLQRAGHSLRDKDYLKCAIFLHEAVNAAALQHFPSDSKDWESCLQSSRDKLLSKATPNQKNAVHALRKLRNALVHGQNAWEPDMATVLARQDNLEERLQECLQAVRNLIDSVEGRRS